MTDRNDRFNGPPDTYWTPPDDVDLIQAQERFEETDEFRTAAVDWMTSDEVCIDFGCDRFASVAHHAYTKAFDQWIAGGGR